MGLEVVYHAAGSAAERLKEILLKDDVTSRANILVRESSSISGSEGVYIRVIGTREQLERVAAIVGNEARRVEGEELEKVLQRLKEEDERTLAGFGSLFG